MEHDGPAEGVDCHSGECVCMSALHHHDVEPRESSGPFSHSLVVFGTQREYRRNLAESYRTASTEQAVPAQIYIKGPVRSSCRRMIIRSVKLAVCIQMLN